MAKAITLPRAAIELADKHLSDAASSVVVLACACALILAGQPLPL